MAITKDEKKRLCKEDYMNGVPVEDIIATRKISKSTFYNWLRKGNWAEERKEKDSNYLSAPEKLEAKINDLVEKMEATNDPTTTAKYADSFSKLLGVIRKLYKTDNRRSWIIFTVGEMMLYLKTTDYPFTEEFMDNMDKFLEKFQDAMLNKYPLNK